VLLGLLMLAAQQLRLRRAVPSAVACAVDTSTGLGA
jgi:hypothetical protein